MPALCDLIALASERPLVCTTIRHNPQAKPASTDDCLLHGINRFLAASTINANTIRYTGVSNTNATFM